MDMKINNPVAMAAVLGPFTLLAIQKLVLVVLVSTIVIR